MTYHYIIWKLKALFRIVHNNIRLLQIRIAVILSCVFIYYNIVAVITQQQDSFTGTPDLNLHSAVSPPVPYNVLPFNSTEMRVEHDKLQISQRNSKASKNNTEFVAGWFYDTNRDTKTYIQPNYATAVHEPKDLCLKNNKTSKLFLIAIVCSSADNFERRKVIRETWGNHQKYHEGLIIFNKIQEKYNLEHDSHLQSNTSSKQFNDSIGKTVTEIPEFRLAFMLGKPKENNTTVQKIIDDEKQKFDDIIQEEFIDSYNNLTLKSIMMLKWITNKCHNSVRYIIKTDDDTYVNIPRLITNLNSKSQVFDKKASKGNKNKEYLLMGHLIRNAKPIRDPNDKWYSPTYLFDGSSYPKYLSGAAYVMSMPTALVLYNTALRTDFFHMEDIYITGICASKAKPKIVPQDEPLFKIYPIRLSNRCHAYTHIIAHRLVPDRMRQFHSRVLVEAEVDKCERIRHSKKGVHKIFTKSS